jgi:hypothetical protein
MTEHRSRFGRWLHDTFHDMWFRSLIGPSQVDRAIHGADREAREQWKRDLENRRRYTREQRELKRQARTSGDG